MKQSTRSSSRVNSTLTTPAFASASLSSSSNCPDALSAMDQPTGDGINTYVVARAVSETGMKVALSGLGGDELFGGYPSFSRLAAASSWLRLWGRAPQPVRNVVARGIEAAGGSSVAAMKRAALAASDGDLANLYAPLRQVLVPQQRTALLEPEWAERSKAWSDPYAPMLNAAFGNGRSQAVLSCVSYAEARTYMHDVLLRDTDQLGMAHPLEVRVPLLDHVLAEYVVSLPDAYKRTNGVAKRLLVDSLELSLPAAVTHRPKQGFTLPLATWMRGELRGYCEERLSAAAAGRSWRFSTRATRSHVAGLSRRPPSDVVVARLGAGRPGGLVGAQRTLMHALHVIPSIAPRYGGPSSAVVGMSNALQHAGVAVQIATTDADGPTRLRVPHGTSVEWAGVPTVFFPRQWSESFKYSRPLAGWLMDHVAGFDVVHIHAVFSHACLAAARRAADGECRTSCGRSAR